MDGLVIKGIGGFYFVETENGILRAKGRGNLKKDKAKLMVGDIVSITQPDDDESDATITSIYDRRSFFQRPPIANCDMLIIVVSCESPKPVKLIIDKMTVMALKSNVEPVICVTKADIGEKEIIDDLRNTYAKTFKFVVLSGATGEGKEQITNLIGDKTAALAGASGVGKSTLTNALIPKASMETGEINKKISRGKHTTRHVEMFHLGDGYIFDTPGFTSLEISGIEEEELEDYFPEISEYSYGCRFDDCAHGAEPGCNVTKAVTEGLIPQSRYDSYRKCREEIHNTRKY